MNDVLEQDLRDAYAERDAGYDPTHAAERLRARSYRPRVSRHRRLWAAAGASGTMLTGGIVAAVLLLSSGAGVAYAGWSPVPATATPADVAASTSMCNHAVTSGDSSTPIQEFPGQPVLSETRGIYTAVVNVSDGRVYDCLTSGTMSNQTSFTVSTQSFGPIQTAPGPAQLSTPYTEQGGVGEGRGQRALIDSLVKNLSFTQRAIAIRRFTSGGGYGEHILGQAGSGVSAVTFTFADGDTVAATVQDGWYFAWWPWLTDPTSVQVTTSSGTVASPMTESTVGADDPAPACDPGSNGCAFSSATGSSSSTTATTTTAATPATTTTP